MVAFLSSQALLLCPILQHLIVSQEKCTQCCEDHCRRSVEIQTRRNYRICRVRRLHDNGQQETPLDLLRSCHRLLFADVELCFFWEQTKIHFSRFSVYVFWFLLKNDIVKFSQKTCEHFFQRISWLCIVTLVKKLSQTKWNNFSEHLLDIHLLNKKFQIVLFN